MTNVRLIVVGKLKEAFLREYVDEYVKRLSRYCKLSIIEVDDVKISEKSSIKEEENVKQQEGVKILKQIKKDDFVLLIDLHGKEIDSETFANEYQKIVNVHPVVDVVIAGSLGYSQDVINRANYRLCLSKMTFTHQMTRVIILEQIYRAYKINRNEVYHK